MSITHVELCDRVYSLGWFRLRIPTPRRMSSERNVVESERVAGRHTAGRTVSRRQPVVTCRDVWHVAIERRLNGRSASLFAFWRDRKPRPFMRAIRGRSLCQALKAPTFVLPTASGFRTKTGSDVIRLGPYS